MAQQPKIVDKTNDRPVGPQGSEAEITVIQEINQFFTQAEDAKWERLRRNRRNRDVFYGRQDWSHKQRGQSTEFLPKVAVSVEQMTAFIKRGMVQFGNWYSIDVNRSLSHIVTGAQLTGLYNCFLENLWSGNNNIVNISTVISDAVKNGLLESLMILKVHGGMMPNRVYSLDPVTGDLKWEDTKEWRLRIDHVRPEDYYPDPTGNGMFEIHRVERDLHELLAATENGVYDESVVKQLIDMDYPRALDEERTDEDRNQDQDTTPMFRKRVVIDEFWGTLLNPDGTVANRNCVSAVANQRFLIRPPEPNPFWHQESPFVASPLVRVPWSVWHRALYDQASDLNLALNEVFNLIIDGGIASVWGVKQIRLEDLEDPQQVAGGVQQGDTLAVKQTLPHNAKVLERVDTGNVPQDAMAVFEFLNREYTQAALTNEIKLGSLPAKQVRATEVVEASQSQAVTLDGIVADLETDFLTRVLRKGWLTILQNADDVPPENMKTVGDSIAAGLIMRAPPEERFQLFGGMCSFKVNGLSATMQKAMDFQKLMAAIQAMSSTPMLLAAMLRRFSGNKIIDMILQKLQINPEDMEMDQQELAEAQGGGPAAATGAAANLLNGGGGASAPGAEGNGGAPVGGGSGLPAQINQNVNPTSGIVPNA